MTLTSPSLYDEYESYVLKYQKDYGDKVVVLYQCGSFYEIYSCGDGLVNMKELCTLLNIQMSRRNKSILEVNRSNTMMAGFPDYTLQKFLNILVDDFYTVVVVSQISPPPKPKRSVTQIVSPGTRLVEHVDTNILMTIYVEDHPFIVIGMALIDLSSGVSKCYEIAHRDISNYKHDDKYPLDELYKLITIHNPKEIILFGPVLKTYNFEMLTTHLDISDKCVHNKLNMGFPDSYLHLDFQTQFLTKIFPMHGLLSPIEYLGLERMPLALISYIMLIHFSYQHDENIVKKLNIPDIMQTDGSQRLLDVSYNANKQLNLTQLNSIINNSKTSIGKRYFKFKLFNPSAKEQDITKSYEAISSQKDCYIETRQHLENVYDLERLFRKLRMNMIHPASWSQIISSLRALNNLGYNQADDFLEHVVTHVDENAALKYHLDNIGCENFFIKNIYIHLDALQDEHDTHVKKFDEIASILSLEKLFKVEYTEREGYFLTITTKRFNDIRNSLSNTQICTDMYMKDVELKPISASSAVLKMHHPYLKKLNEQISHIKEILKNEIIKTYKEFVQDCDDKFNSMFDPCIEIIGHLDFVSTCAFNAQKLGHIRPVIDIDSSTPYLNVKAIRHPIVEHLQQNVEYVTNDITLNGNGMLLYGLNSAGKSTLMKSCGLSIIMAQAGMFVPCASMTFFPFKHIFTRIPSGDDIMKGQSTFTVEIRELKNILHRSNKESLVIGDELCSGTENISAMSIVSAGIYELCKKEIAFMFATHLHDLKKVSKLKELPNLNISHLSVHFEDASGKLIYNRKLMPGQGTSLYGLEVCKSLNMGDSFISLAKEIRREIVGISSDILTTSTSHYNSKKYIDSFCEVCGNPCSPDVHHIKEQHIADINGFIDSSFHKNRLHNLTNVCKKCHIKIHKEEIHISGYQQTSTGIELNIQECIPESSNKNQEEQVIGLFQSGKSMKYIIENVEHITRYRATKIIQSFKSTLHPIN